MKHLSPPTFFVAILWLCLAGVASCSSTTRLAISPSLTPGVSPTLSPSAIATTIVELPGITPTHAQPTPTVVSSQPISTATPIPIPPTRVSSTATPVPPTATPLPLASVIIQNMDVQITGGLCYAIADVENTGSVVAYSVTGTALLVAADGGANGVSRGSFNLNGQTNLYPGQTERYSGFVSISNLTQTPVYITVTIFQSGHQIAQASTLFPAVCHS